jgi:ABC-type multidrug transport system fused ATPase/permease subunit
MLLSRLQWHRGMPVWVKYITKNFSYFHPAKVLGVVRESGADKSTPCKIYVRFFGPKREM